VQIGDLVRYQAAVRGLDGLMGLIIATNGEAFDVRWIQARPSGLQTTAELPYFIEKVENET
jgi:hypothetical protein